MSVAWSVICCGCSDRLDLAIVFTVPYLILGLSTDSYKKLEAFFSTRQSLRCS